MSDDVKIRAYNVMFENGSLLDLELVSTRLVALRELLAERANGVLKARQAQAILQHARDERKIEADSAQNELDAAKREYERALRKYRTKQELLNAAGMKCNEHARKLKSEESSLERIKEDLERLEPIPIYVFENEIVVEERYGLIKPDFKGSDSLYRALLSCGCVEKLTIEQIRMLSKVLATVRNLGAKSVVMFDDEKLEEAFEYFEDFS
ncbi:hypothetical protein IJH89_02115 [Candidatus Saccharibacteria bacterium]|nr:hypothetical protein [Candidatus Saccharibacteria bacterium]